jgi:hypothetical protein
MQRPVNDGKMSLFIPLKQEAKAGSLKKWSITTF